jgi:hypothetical protein
MPEARTRNWRHELLSGITGGLLDQGKVQVTASFARRMKELLHSWSLGRCGISAPTSTNR